MWLCFDDVHGVNSTTFDEKEVQGTLCMTNVKLQLPENGQQ